MKLNIFCPLCDSGIFYRDQKENDAQWLKLFLRLVTAHNFMVMIILTRWNWISFIDCVTVGAFTDQKENDVQWLKLFLRHATVHNFTVIMLLTRWNWIFFVHCVTVGAFTETKKRMTCSGWNFSRGCFFSVGGGISWNQGHGR